MGLMQISSSPTSKTIGYIATVQRGTTFIEDCGLFLVFYKNCSSKLHCVSENDRWHNRL